MSGSGFWHMGGYAFFVWGSYGVALALFVGELVALSRRKGAVARRLEQVRRVSRQGKV